MRLIDADRLKEVFRRNVVGGNSYFDLIDAQPTMNAVPVIHADWKRGYTMPDGVYYKCSNCNELIKVRYPMLYCCNCGALMDGGKENERL